jgi:hypothetical protein
MLRLTGSTETLAFAVMNDTDPNMTFLECVRVISNSGMST